MRVSALVRRRERSDAGDGRHTFCGLFWVEGSAPAIASEEKSLPKPGMYSSGASAAPSPLSTRARFAVLILPDSWSRAK